MEEHARRTVKRWRDAMAGMRAFVEFDISFLPGLLTEEEWAAASEVLADVRAQCDRFMTARPRELRLIREGA